MWTAQIEVEDHAGSVGGAVKSTVPVDFIMQITRRYTVAGNDPFGAVPFVKRTSRIVNPDGTVVFELKDLLAPEPWSQVAVDILAQKYFRSDPASCDRKSIRCSRSNPSSHGW